MSEINYEAWAKSLKSFIESKGLETECRQYVGGWPIPFDACPTPADMVMVPRVPTEGMYALGEKFTAKAFAKGFETDAEELYTAMLEAWENQNND